MILLAMKYRNQTFYNLQATQMSLLRNNSFLNKSAISSKRSFQPHLIRFQSSVSGKCMIDNGLWIGS